MPKDFVLPDLGEGISEAQIIRLLVKRGDVIAQDQYLMEVETDKAAVEIPSPYVGVVQNVHVREGQTVKVGHVLITFDDAPAGAQAQGPAPVPAGASAGGSPQPAGVIGQGAAAAPPPAVRKTTAAAAPAVRRLAREMGVDIDSLKGTGPGGRVTKEDVENHARQVAAPPPPAAASPVPPARPVSPTLPARRPVPHLAGPMLGVPGSDKWGPVRHEPLNQIRKTIAAHMKRSVSTIPHVTHTDEADITALDRLRRELNYATGNDPKLTFMPFVIRATCLALHKYPIFNSSFDEENEQIIYKDYINMGVAVDSQRGLIVPVIRNADQMSLRALVAELRTIADRVRSNQFGIEELRGGTFTITNVGPLGGLFTTPIINHPEVAILGLGRSRTVPVVKEEQMGTALVLPLSMSFDHRATDGANAARFTREIISYLEAPARFLLD